MEMDLADRKSDLESNPASVNSSEEEPMIFVVDDEPAVAEVIEALLDLHGRRARVFTQPEKALEAFKEAEPKPRLLIADFQMPKMNGLELLQHCKAEDSNLRCISASGTLQVEDMRQYPIQPDKYLAKPFYPRQLLDLVDEMLKD